MHPLTAAALTIHELLTAAAGDDQAPGRIDRGELAAAVDSFRAVDRGSDGSMNRGKLIAANYPRRIVFNGISRAGQHHVVAEIAEGVLAGDDPRGGLDLDVFEALAVDILREGMALESSRLAAELLGTITPAEMALVLRLRGHKWRSVARLVGLSSSHIRRLASEQIRRLHPRTDVRPRTEQFRRGYIDPKTQRLTAYSE